MIDALLNENSEFKKYKVDFQIFNFYTLSHSLTIESIMMPIIIQKAWTSAIFWCIICLDILYISRDMAVLVQLAQTTSSPPLSNLKTSGLLIDISNVNVLFLVPEISPF